MDHYSGIFGEFLNGPNGAMPISVVQAKASSYDYSGIALRVINILESRIGQSGLNIEDISNEMAISKRTLQRRLRDQKVNFADLRDRVRFSQAIECMLFKSLSIEATSRYLDFTDRTSFTNAFKRWTGVSPRAFRANYSAA